MKATETCTIGTPDQANGQVLSRPRVLIADDHPAMIEQLTFVLNTHFEIVGCATDGKSLVDASVRLRPDIIVSDIGMPVLNGIEAVESLSRIGSTAKVVFVTMYQQKEIVEACLSAGGMGFVTKSRLGTDLVYAVTEALSNRSFVSPIAER